MRNQIKKEDALKIVLAALLIYKETGVTSVSCSSFPLSRTKYINPPPLAKKCIDLLETKAIIYQK